MQNSKTRENFRKAQESGQRVLNSLYLIEMKLNKKSNQPFHQWLYLLIMNKKRNVQKSKDVFAAVLCARREMEVFQQVLQEVEMDRDLQEEITCFLFFADFFLCELTEETLQQIQYEEVRGEVRDTIDRVRNILLEIEKNND